jgi:predicted glycosyltransferase
LRPATSAKKDIALTALISGPEPQRSLFEKEVLKLMKESPGRKVLIRGILDSSTEKIADTTDMEVYDFLDDTALSEMISRSEWVVCRSGYSTLCDLRVLGAKAVVVPTPQQPEQLYLARRGSEQGWFQSSEQRFISEVILEDRQKFIPVDEGDLLTPVLKGFLGKL